MNDIIKKKFKKLTTKKTTITLDKTPTKNQANQQ